MEYKRFDNTLVVRIEVGEEILQQLKLLCKIEKICLGSITGLGALNRVALGLFDTAEKKYYSNKLEGEYELVSFIGNITEMKGEVYLHCHASIADITGKTWGGHLNEAWVSATAELVITVINGEVNRQFSDKIGLNLLKF